MDYVLIHTLFPLCFLQIAVRKKVSSLNGNTVYSEGFHGPNGLHKTPNHWCRYCGSRVSKRWSFKNRICSKHLHLFRRCSRRGYPKIVYKVFGIENGKIGRDLLNGPYDVTQNAERHYLEYFAKDKKGKKGKKGGSGTASGVSSGSSEDEQSEFKVARLHSMKQIFKESDDDDDDGDGTEKSIRLFLVEWSGYGIGDSSWEPEENLMCSEALRGFESQLEDNRMRECVHRECGIDGYRVYTRPCMRHHFENQEYAAYFENYNNSVVRQLANCKPDEVVIEGIHKKFAKM